MMTPLLIWMSAIDALIAPMIPLWFAWVYDPMWRGGMT